MSIRSRRISAWLVGIISMAVIVALIITAVFDLQIGDSTSSVSAAVAAVIGLAISVITLIRSSVSAWPPPATTQIRAKGQGAIAAGGSIHGNAIGKNSKVMRAPDTSAHASPADTLVGDVAAEGPVAISAGGDITNNAIGEGSER